MGEIYRIDEESSEKKKIYVKPYFCDPDKTLNLSPKKLLHRLERIFRIVRMATRYKPKVELGRPSIIFKVVKCSPKRISNFEEKEEIPQNGQF